MHVIIRSMHATKYKSTSSHVCYSGMPNVRVRVCAFVSVYERARLYIYTHQYKLNQLKLVKINLKSRIFGVHTIPKSDESQALWIVLCIFEKRWHRWQRLMREDENHQVGCCLRQNEKKKLNSFNVQCWIARCERFSVMDEVKSVHLVCSLATGLRLSLVRLLILKDN